MSGETNLGGIRTYNSFKEIEEREKKQFIETYKKIYREPPYHEDFSNADDVILKELKENTTICFWVHDSEGIIGFALGGKTTYPDSLARYFPKEESIYIAELGVRPDCQNCGIGNTLLSYILSQFTTLKQYTGKTIFLRTGKNNTSAIMLYKKHGFKRKFKSNGLPLMSTVTQKRIYPFLEEEESRIVLYFENSTNTEK